MLSAGYYEAYYLKALKVKALIKKAFDEAFARYDLILGPVAPTTAPKLGESLTDPIKMYLGDIYTVSVNLAGLPAISLPCGKDSRGMPVGLQLIGDCFQEKKLFRAASAYEKARGDFGMPAGGAMAAAAEAGDRLPISGREGIGIGRGSGREGTDIGEGSGREETGIGRGSGREETGIGEGSGREETGIGEGSGQEGTGIGRGSGREETDIGEGSGRERIGIGNGSGGKNGIAEGE